MIFDAKRKSLQSFIKEKMTSEEPIPQLVAGQYLRASSIHDLCPRFEAIRVQRGIVGKFAISPTLRKTFDFGRAYERFFRDEFLGNLGLVIGKWKCTICTFAEERNERYAKPKECTVCGGGQFAYVEEDLEGEGIGGHPDGFLCYDGKYYILELKTTNSFNFKSIISAPMPKHVSQAQVYMHLTGYKSALIWYFNKDTSEDLQHEILYDPKAVEYLFGKVRTLKNFFETNILPERICATQECLKARKCSLGRLCFLS